MRRVLAVLILVLMFPLTARAGGGGVDTSGCEGYSEGTVISMRDSCFAGTAHFAPSGTVVTITNDGQLPHTFTAVDGSFDSGQVGPTGKASLSFDEPGIYRVFCTLHGTATGQGMAGVLIVGEAIPAAVTAPMDTTAIREAVSDEAAAIVAAIEAQQSSIRSLHSAEAKLLVALDGISPSDEIEPVVEPHVVAVQDDQGTERLVVAILGGLAAGLSLAALMTSLVLRMRGTDGRSGSNPEPAAL